MFSAPFRANEVHFYLRGRGMATETTQDTIVRFLRNLGMPGRLPDPNENLQLKHILSVPNKLTDRYRDPLAGNLSFGLHADAIVVRAFVSGSAADPSTGWTRPAGEVVLDSVVMLEACAAADLNGRMRTITG